MNKDLEIIDLRPDLITFFYSKQGISFTKAEGLYQDLFIKVRKSIEAGSYREEGKFKSWIFNVANNMVMDFYRRRKRISRKTYSTYKGKSSFEYIPDPDLNMEEILIEAENFKTLKEVIKMIDPPQREVIEMRIYKRMAFREVVEETGRGLNTVLGNYRYGIINIKKKLKLWNPKLQLKI